jgi:hypothetical protein
LEFYCAFAMKEGSQFCHILSPKNKRNIRRRPISKVQLIFSLSIHIPIAFSISSIHIETDMWFVVLFWFTLEWACDS